MHTYLHTLTSILIIAILILLVAFLRHRGILKQEDGILFSRLVTQISLPALIFSALANAKLEWDYILLFLIMFGSELILLFISWIIGNLLKLSPKEMGSFLLVSTFGSSALLGYPLINELFPHNYAALAEGVFVSELGVGLPLFTLGVMIAIYYGHDNKNIFDIKAGGMLFFKSPIFVAIILGMIWSYFSFGVNGILITPLFEVIHILSQANTFLVALTVGVLLNFSSFRNILWMAFFVLILKLILAPLLVYFPVNMLSLKSWQLEVLLLEAAMPSAMLSVVLAKQYGCDAQLAAKLVFLTLLFSLFTVSLMINL